VFAAPTSLHLEGSMKLEDYWLKASRILLNIIER
jgi:hypothetical protein